MKQNSSYVDAVCGLECHVDHDAVVISAARVRVNPDHAEAFGRALIAMVQAARGKHAAASKGNIGIEPPSGDMGATAVGTP